MMGDMKEHPSKEQQRNSGRMANEQEIKDWHRNREKEQEQAHVEGQHRCMEQPAGARVSHLPLESPSSHLVLSSRVPGHELLSCS